MSASPGQGVSEVNTGTRVTRVQRIGYLPNWGRIQSLLRHVDGKQAAYVKWDDWACPELVYLRDLTYA